MKLSIRILIFSIVLLLGVIPARAQAKPVVQAVFFFNPDCDNCHQVITKVLPPLQTQYGTQLVILQIDTSNPEGSKLYQAMSRHFQLAEDRLGTPAIVIGTTVLVGVDEISAKLSSLIDKSLANGGVDWPDIPDLASFTQNAGKSEPYPSPQVYAQGYPQPLIQSAGTSQSDSTSIWERFLTNFKKDPIANSLAVVILVGMLISIFVVVFILIRSIFAENPSPVSFKIPGWVIPILIVIGLGVAGYLTFIEVGKKPALCGPVGHCNEVQNSPYANLFGILPVGVLGLMGYTGILAAWGVQKFGPKGLRTLSAMALWGMSLFGVAFSIYLTFLEPFVIGATCMWCLSSALLMTAFLWVTTPGLQNILAVEDDTDENDSELSNDSSR